MSISPEAKRLVAELDDLILLALEAQARINGGKCCLKPDEFEEWANLMEGFQQSFEFMQMHMQTPHRTGAFH